MHWMLNASYRKFIYWAICHLLIQSLGIWHGAYARDEFNTRCLPYVRM